jgi:4-amino-4-deoxy-L-arabinose transferase-like glycosyltransferase
MKALFATLLWGALALLTLVLLARNVLAIPVLAPLDPNEGWNAAHALSLLAGKGLYPSPQSLMVNNYPPLSFYLAAALTKLTGDAVIAGRILSLLSFLGICAGLALVVRQMRLSTHAQWAAVLFFAATLLVASDYVGMDDPQLLGHAVQLFALLLLLQGRPLTAAAGFAVSLFIKHNLLALPLPALLWLWQRDRSAALRFAIAGGGLAVLGLVLFSLTYGTSLLAVIASPRLISPANIISGVSHLWWAALPLAALYMLRDPRREFCLIYALIALSIGLLFSAGDGVDVNVFFDLVLACALGLGLVAETNSARAALCALPLPLFLVFHFHDDNFFFTPDFRGASARDIAFLKSQPGPALCDQLSLCLWAGKGAEVDVFNVGEQIKTGARDPSTLAQMIAEHRFATLQLSDLSALGEPVRKEIEKHYRVDHSDDNGTFFTPAF